MIPLEEALLLDFMCWLFDSDEFRSEHHDLVREFLKEREA